MDYSIIIRHIQGNINTSESKEMKSWLAIPENKTKYDKILELWEASSKFHESIFITNIKKIGKYLAESWK